MAEATSDRASAAPRHRSFGFWTAMVVVVTITAGLLFGYDQGVISGALPFIKEDFDLSSFQTEVVTSWVTLGALFGALFAGLLADRIGRRRTGILAGLLFTAGALLESTAQGVDVLVVGRLVVGFGVGVASVAAPLYAAEMARTEVRGRFVSMYQLAITIGIFVAYVVDDALTEGGDWRPMLGLAAIPGVLLVITMATMTDTPRWLLKVGRRDEAHRAIARVRDPDEIDEQLAEAEEELAASADQASWGEVFGKGLRRPLVVGVGLALFQQITGINAIIYYANEIFAEAGFSTPQEQAQATLWAIGAVNVLATFIAIAFVDRFGRRPLLQAGLVGMIVSLTAVGLAFLAFDETPTAAGGPSTVGIITLICLVVYIASFAFSLGPIVWTVISEIYPNRVRGRAIAVATAVNWGAAFLVSEFFLSLIDGIGTSATFWLFAAAGVVALIWITLRVPETKGRSLEEIQELWGSEAA